MTGLIYLSNERIGLNGYQQYINQAGLEGFSDRPQESKIKLYNHILTIFIPMMFSKQRYIADFISGMKNYKYLGFFKVKIYFLLA